jgi:preprotein translocase subunit SecB
MNASPLQMVNCSFTEVRLSARPDAVDEDVNRIDFSVEPETFKRTKESQLEWIVLVRVKIAAAANAKPGYTGEVEAIGTFDVNAAWPPDKIEQLVFVNGAGMVYGAIRELVCNITSRGLWRMLTLPSYSFLSHYQEKMEKESALGHANAQPATGPQDSAIPPVTERKAA